MSHLTIPGYLTDFGKAGELWVARQLRQRGFSVQHIGGKTDYDILVDGRARVEVKSAFLTKRAGRNGAYQYSLRRHGKVNDEDLLILLCCDEWDGESLSVLAAFVIPGDVVLSTLSKIDITSANPTRYTGRWARYINAWDLIASIVESCSPRLQEELFTDEPDPDDEEIPF